MENAVNESVEGMDKQRSKSPKRPAKWKPILIGIIVIIAVIIAAISYYQANYFNTHIKINDTNVGGLTA
jgi:hypothetical protein